MLIIAVTVVVIRARFHDFVTIFRCELDGYQLDCYDFPVCFLCGDAVCYVLASLRRPETVNRCCICAAAPGELDSLCWHQDDEYWSRILRPDPHWVGTTVCAGCSNELLGLVVYQQWQSRSDCSDESCKPTGRSIGPIDQPILGR